MNCDDEITMLLGCNLMSLCFLVRGEPIQPTHRVELRYKTRIQNYLIIVNIHMAPRLLCVFSTGGENVIIPISNFGFFIKLLNNPISTVVI